MILIDDVCKQKNLEGPFIIKIDVEGAELKVLAGAKRTLKETELVILEVNLYPYFINGPEFTDVIYFMNELGYVTYDICNLNFRPIDNALAQVDMVFVKGQGISRKCNRFKTHKQRANEFLKSARPDQ